ncbi:uncharacterized protein A1O5_05665 [Cladophialophora psammophila CBS 110553]|uniref:Uncharacterized protein n=1 Tax=Cladophialophora psammophila CBS 110553 TaxID=1182543 RepID=W9X021_9EURO|nr:uncharacterized protein A1O5_05665 [Cladophialophora psammophila CBS 110553]EXJ70675.1 hypothetical protein A1O5_05665 [Cladophialophora psammophila CBS 110553]
MSLVYNLVTQQDAVNNFQIAAAMKQDSTSMNSISSLTMAFLPGTFTASVIGGGILEANSGSRIIRVTALLWLWAAITVPLHCHGTHLLVVVQDKEGNSTKNWRSLCHCVGSYFHA